jgi:hypothetical protein
MPACFQSFVSNAWSVLVQSEKCLVCGAESTRTERNAVTALGLNLQREYYINSSYLGISVEGQCLACKGKVRFWKRDTRKLGYTEKHWATWCLQSFNGSIYKTSIAARRNIAACTCGVGARISQQHVAVTTLRAWAWSWQWSWCAIQAGAEQKRGIMVHNIFWAVMLLCVAEKV